MELLTKKQREHLLSLISEGLNTKEINKRAAKFKPPYHATRQHIAYYRKTRSVKIEEIKEVGETSALKKGFAIREKRVESLNTLAEKLYQELIESVGLWLPQMKMIGSGKESKLVEYEEFNAEELRQFRGLLDDIAKEVGERISKQELSGEIEQKIIVQYIDGEL